MILPTRAKILLMAAMFAVGWFVNLQHRDLFQTDEGRYAEIPREMVASGDWITPRLDGFKYFEKPALQYWATAVAYELFGESNWTSRLWTALTGFLGVLMTAWVGWRLFDRATAWCAALLLGSSIYYIIMGHFNTLDMGVSFFMCLSLFAFLLAMQSSDLGTADDRGAEGTGRGGSPRSGMEDSGLWGGARGPMRMAARRGWMYLAWAAAALGMLSKGLETVVLPGAVFILYTLATRDWQRWRQLHYYGGILIFLAIAGPWYALISLRNPEFLEYFFVRQHFERFLTPIAHRSGSWWYFLPILVFALMPWWPQGVRAAGRLFKRAAAPVPSGRFNYTLFLWIWCIFIVAFFSYSQSKLASYILPVVPAFALIIGQELARRRRGDMLVSAGLCMVLAIAALWLAPLVQSDGSGVTLGLYKAFVPWLAAGCGLLLGVSIVGFVLAYFRHVGVSMALVGAGILVATQVVTSGAQALSPVYSGRSLAKQIVSYDRPNIPFYSVDGYQQSLPFYLNRTLTLVAYQGELGFGISLDRQQWVPDIATFTKRWQADPQALAVMPRGTYRMLMKQGVPMQVIGRDPKRIAVRKP